MGRDEGIRTAERRRLEFKGRGLDALIAASDQGINELLDIGDRAIAKVLPVILALQFEAQALLGDSGLRELDPSVMR